MIQTGSRIGPYEITGRLGAGGMGEVYRARDTRLERSVAIKVLPSGLSQNAELRARFQREARAISQLSDPHICTLHDVGQEDGIDYLVMELLDGETLSDRLSKGPLPLVEALRYGAEIAGALASAHRGGITHRDLKPANVMITRSGAKLLDFGLAKAAPAVVSVSPDDETRRGDHMRSEPPLTARGTILGTFQYMAPEQLEGLEADARTDIFALGSLLYEMVTGKRAFEGKTRTSLIAAIVDRDPAPITSIQPLSPHALARVIETCMAKNPDDRWQSARDVQLQLLAIASGREVAHGEGATRPRSVWLAWSVAALSIAAMSAWALWQFSRSVAAPVYRSAILPPAKSELFVTGPYAGSQTISPDSRYLTFAAPGADGIGRIWVRELASGSARPLTGTEGGIYPFWSPDSRQIGFFVNRRLKTISVEGGAAVEVCEASEARGGTWSSQGVILFAPHWRDPIYRVPATGGKPVAVTRLEPKRNETTHRWPLFLPDGKHFLYLAASHTSEITSGNNAVYLGSIEGGEPRMIVRARSNVAIAAGHLLFMRGNTLVAQRFDAKSFEVEGDPITVAQDVRYVDGFFQGIFSATDRLLLFQEGSEIQSQLNIIGEKGETLRMLSGPAVYLDIQIAPNGEVAVAAIGDPCDLWLLDLERGTRRRLTSDAWQELSPRWSPDSKSLVYYTDRAVQVDTLRLSLDSSSATTFAGDPAFHEKPLDWSRDGRFVVISKEAVQGSNQADLWVYPTDPASKPVPYLQTPHNEWDARIAPNGKLLAYVSDESGRAEVYVSTFPTAGEKWPVSRDGGQAPRWIRNGTELLFAAPNSAMMAVDITPAPFAAGAPKTLFHVPIDFSPDPYYDVNADGTQFIISQPDRLQQGSLTLIANWTSLLAK